MIFHAPYDYDLMLVNILECRWGEAITAARRGLASNPYIAETLLGNKDPHPLPMADDGGCRAIHDAKYYALHCGGLWKRTEDALALLRWVNTHPLALESIAALRERRHGRLREEPGTAAQLGRGVSSSSSTKRATKCRAGCWSGRTTTSAYGRGPGSDRPTTGHSEHVEAGCGTATGRRPTVSTSHCPT